MPNSGLADRFFSARLWVHLAVYAGLVVTLLFVFPSSGSFSSDDGAYAGQVFALQQGDWALDRPLTDIDPINEGWVNSYVSSDGPLPYVRHPAYVYVLLASSTIFGHTYGLGVPAVAGSILCVLAAWLLANEFSRRSAPSAFWIVGLGPLLINSTTFWAHTLASGLAGFGLWGAVRVVRKHYLESSKFWVLTGVVGFSNAAAILLRTEAVLWFAGLTVSFFALDHSRRVVAMFAAASGPAIGAFLFDRWWGQSILNRYEIVNVSSAEEPSWLSSRVPAGFHLLLSPSDGTGVLFIIVGLCLIIYGAVKFRFGPEIGIAGSLMSVGSILFVVPLFFELSDISGLFPAWPILIVAGIIGSKPDQSTDRPGLSLLYVPAGFLITLVFLTQYAGGGGLEWGARYLSPAFVGLGVLAALNLRCLVEKAPLALVALVACPAILGVGVAYKYHVRKADFVSTASVGEPDVVIASHPVGTRIAWSTLPAAWYTTDDENLHDLLVQVTETNAERIAIFGFVEPDLVTPAGYEVVEVSNQLFHVVAK